MNGYAKRKRSAFRFSHSLSFVRWFFVWYEYHKESARLSNNYLRDYIAWIDWHWIKRKALSCVALLACSTYTSMKKQSRGVEWSNGAPLYSVIAIICFEVFFHHLVCVFFELIAIKRFSHASQYVWRQRCFNCRLSSSITADSRNSLPAQKSNSHAMGRVC